jgi:hypothetical protein
MAELGHSRPFDDVRATSAYNIDREADIPGWQKSANTGHWQQTSRAITPQ